MTDRRIFRISNQSVEHLSHERRSSKLRVTFRSGAVDGTGVADRVAGADGCRVTRKVPYLLLSPLRLMVPVLRPVED